MKARIKNADLVGALARLKMVVARKATLPVLSAVLIEASKTGLTITGTDLDTFLALDVAADVERPGSVVVPCARLQAAVDKMEGDELELDGQPTGALLGRAGTMRFDLLGIDPKEFPQRPDLPDCAAQHFPEGIIAEAIGRELSSAGTDQTRYVLCGIYLTATDGKMQMVATDGRRLAVTSLDTPGTALGVILPTDAAKLMACLDGGGATELRMHENQVEACGKGWRMVSKLIEGNYPNWQQVMPPPGASHRFTVGRERLMEAVTFASTICTDKSNSVRVELSKGTITVSVDSPDIGHTSAEIEADVKGKDMTTGFNPEYLLAALGVLTGDEVTGEIADELSPLRLGDGKTVNVLMPMRVS